MDKTQLRHKHQEIRRIKDRFELLKRSLAITQKAIDVLMPYESVGIYISIEDEVNTRAIIEYCFEQKKRVCVPKIIDQRMIFVDIKSLDECIIKGRLIEPISNIETIDPEVQVIPMLAYNAKLFRLGYGKGYYDNYLKNYPGFKVGLCYEFGKDQALLESDFDISCDIILSDD